MPSSPRSAQPSPDYLTIEATVSATEAGRSFLAEFARRSRARDTVRLFEAVAALERTLAVAPASPTIATVGADAPSRLGRASSSGSQRAPATGEACRALAKFLDAAETLQDLSWTLRERGFDPAICDVLDAVADDLHAGCGLQETAVHRILERLDALAAASRGARGRPASTGVGDDAQSLP